MMLRYKAPYILNEFNLHFTLCSSAPPDDPVRESMINKLRYIFSEEVKHEEMEIDEICLMIKPKDQKHWAIKKRYPLSGKV